MNISLEQLAKIIPGRLLSGDGSRIVSGGISTDSRKLSPGSLFFALSGGHFDGNEFAIQAANNGASAVIVTRVVEGIPDSCAVIETDDTLQALQNLASWWREQLENLKVVAITGSNGKTSTKDFTRSVLSQKVKTIATAGNLNNHIGVPLSILSADKTDEAAVWEMGMNHSGELQPLCDMIRPDIGIITGIGSAHIEFMGSREAIAEEKATLARRLPAEGTLIYPSADDFADYLCKSTRATPFPVGGKKDAVRASDIVQTENGSDFLLYIEGKGHIAVSLPVPGRHMVSNALLAAAAGHVLGLAPEEIAKGLSRATLASGRLRQLNYHAWTILDDTYNANPDSMMAALDTLGSLEVADGGKRIAVLGMMGELGSYASQGHALVGRHAAKTGVDILLAVGEGAAEIARSSKESACPPEIFYLEKEEAIKLLPSLLTDGSAILFKGSRSAAMEEIMNKVFPPRK